MKRALSAAKWPATLALLALSAPPEGRAATAQAWERPPPPAIFWAHDFVDSVGANIHLLHPDSPYGEQFELMKQRLLEAGIRHVRDGAMDQRGGFFAGDQAARFQELGRAGIHVTFIFHADVSPAFVQGFPSRVSPAFEAYELPNEINMAHSMPWPEGIRTWMPIFYRYVRDNPATASYPIIGPSLADLGSDPYSQLGLQADYFDYGNLHKYYRSYHPLTAGYGGFGKPPCQLLHYGSLDYSLCMLQKVSGDKPVVCTESGYGSDAAASRQVTPEVQAKYIVRLLLLHLNAGIRRTFLYQLADYGTDGFTTFGLIRSDGSPKPAFLELKALMSELADTAQTRAPDAISLVITRNFQDVEGLLFEKSDGSYRLVLWLEKPGFDPKAGAPLEVPEQTVAISVPRGYGVRSLRVFGDSGAVSVRQLPPGTGRSDIPVPVRDNLTMVDIAPSG